MIKKNKKIEPKNLVHLLDYNNIISPRKKNTSQKVNAVSEHVRVFFSSKHLTSNSINFEYKNQDLNILGRK